MHFLNYTQPRKWPTQLVAEARGSKAIELSIFHFWLYHKNDIFMDREAPVSVIPAVPWQETEVNSNKQQVANGLVIET